MKKPSYWWGISLLCATLVGAVSQYGISSLGTCCCKRSNPVMIPPLRKMQPTDKQSPKIASTSAEVLPGGTIVITTIETRTSMYLIPPIRPEQTVPRSSPYSNQKTRMHSDNVQLVSF